MYPARLQQLLETFDMFPDPADRTGMLLSYSDQFREVLPGVATRPFPKSHHVPQCESDAYVWAMQQADGRSRCTSPSKTPRAFQHVRWRRFSSAPCRV